MPAETLLAMLEDRGYRRHHALHLTRTYIAAVLCHPRDDRGRLRDLRPASEERTPLEQMRDLCRRRGVPEVLIEQRAREMVQESTRTARRRRIPRGR